MPKEAQPRPIEARMNAMDSLSILKGTRGWVASLSSMTMKIERVISPMRRSM